MHVVLLVFGLEVACVVVAAARLRGILLGWPPWVELVARLLGRVVMALWLVACVSLSSIGYRRPLLVHLSLPHSS